MKKLWKRFQKFLNLFCSFLRYKVLRQILYGCCAFLVILVLWGFHFYSPFTYGHVALSSVEINRRKWLKTWDMLSHPNTWHTSFPGPWFIFRSSRLLSLRKNQKDQEIRQGRSPLLNLLRDRAQTKCCVRMSGIVWVCKQVASVACVGWIRFANEKQKTLKTSLHTSNFSRSILTLMASAQTMPETAPSVFWRRKKLVW